MPQSLPNSVSHQPGALQRQIQLQQSSLEIVPAEALSSAIPSLYKAPSQKK